MNGMKNLTADVSEKQLKLSWDEVQLMSEYLAKKVKDDFKPDVVISIASGGLVPGKILKEMLEVKIMGVISAHYYDKTVRRKECVVEKSLSGFVPKNSDHNILVVDDIVETGVTFQEVLKVLPELLGHGNWKIKTATLFVKPQSKFVPDYYVMNASEWVVFPWETEQL